MMWFPAERQSTTLSDIGFTPLGNVQPICQDTPVDLWKRQLTSFENMKMVVIRVTSLPRSSYSFCSDWMVAAVCQATEQPVFFFYFIKLFFFSCLYIWPELLLHRQWTCAPTHTYISCLKALSHPDSRTLRGLSTQSASAAPTLPPAI